MFGMTCFARKLPKVLSKRKNSQCCSDKWQHEEDCIFSWMDKHEAVLYAHQ